MQGITEREEAEDEDRPEPRLVLGEGVGPWAARDLPVFADTEQEARWQAYRFA